MFLNKIYCKRKKRSYFFLFITRGVAPFSHFEVYISSHLISFRLSNTRYFPDNLVVYIIHILRVS